MEGQRVRLVIALEMVGDHLSSERADVPDVIAAVEDSLTGEEVVVDPTTFKIETVELVDGSVQEVRTRGTSGTSDHHGVAPRGIRSGARP